MNESIIISILLLVIIIIVTFYLINKKQKNITEHYDKVFNIRIEDTHHQGLPSSRTAEGIGFTVYPTNNVFETNAYYKIKSKATGDYFVKIKVIKIDRNAFFKKDIISFQRINGNIQGKEYSDVIVTKIPKREAYNMKG